MQEREGFYQAKMAGETLGRYHLLHCIGRGSAGETWLAEDPRLHRQVAIKILPSQQQHDHEYSMLFNREAQAVITLNHPHILPIHDYGERLRADGQVDSYLVMPYIEGGSLAELLKQRSLSQEEALNLLAQAAEAIDYAHAQGAVHHDIKPANMLLRPDLWLLLSDFGIARIVASAQPTEKKAITGTFSYGAPEQAQGDAVAASDRYSLAVIAYQLLTSHHPFQTKTGSSIVNLKQSPSSPRRWKPVLPAACEDVLLHGLAKKPDDRYPTAHEFVEELTRSLTVPTTTDKAVTRRNLLIGVGATALIGAGGIWTVASGRLPFGAMPASTPASLPDPDGPTKILRGHKKPAHALAFSPAAGRMVLASVCNGDSTVKLWNLQTFSGQQTVVNKSTASKELGSTQLALAWSSDGGSLALGGVDEQGHSKIDVYHSDLSGPVAGLEQGFSLSEAGLTGLGWIKQTLLAALYTPAHDNGQHFLLGLWNTQEPALKPQPVAISGVLSPSGYESTYRSLAVSLDGTRLAIGTTQGALVGSAELVGKHVLWKPASSGLLQAVPGEQTGNAINELSWIWTKDGVAQSLLSITQGKPNLLVGWNIDGATPHVLVNISELNNFPPFTTIATSSNTQKHLYAAGTQSGEVYLWDDDTGQLPKRILKGGSIKGRVIALALSPDELWLAASYDDRDASIAIWEM